MKSKMFEIRDECTCITAIAIKTEPENLNEHAHFRRGGWGSDSVILIKSNGETRAEYDPFAWRKDGTRTMFQAHLYIQEHFDELENFSVIDVQYILGETENPKQSDLI